MITQPTSVEELKDMFLEIFLATTDKVTKVTPSGIVNATAFGVGKVSQKVLKDVAILESNIFPDTAFGVLLDGIAERDGKPARFTETGSSVYVRLVGDVGTIYLAATHKFTGKHGIEFELEVDATIGATGFTYARVSSTTLGADANIDPITLTQVIPSPPTGHDFVTNEYRANGGQDAESDVLFRRRIKEGVNVLGTTTLSAYEQAFMKINNKVLRIYKGGFTDGGLLRIIVSTVDGQDLSAGEIITLNQEAQEFLGFTDQLSGISIENITYHPIDVSMRVELSPTVDIDDTRKGMQISMQKLLDWRLWEFGDTIEFEDLLLVARQTTGVERVLEGFFVPSGDITPPIFTLPRIRGFLMYDADGVLLSDSGGTLNPTFYPSDPDDVFQLTVQSSI